MKHSLHNMLVLVCTLVLEHILFRYVNYAQHKYESMYIWYIPSLGTSYCSYSYTRDSSSAADREGGGQQVQFALGPQCKQALKQCSTHSNTHPSLASLRVLFHCIVNFKSACFHASRLCCSNTNFNAHMLHVYCAVHQLGPSMSYFTI